MALLTGMTPDGTEVPVQVDPSGRLVAEGLTGPQGAAGSQGIQGEKGDKGEQGVPGIPWSLNGADAYYSGGRVLVGTSNARSGFYNGALASQVQIEGSAADSFLSLTRYSNNISSPVFILAKTRATSIGGNTIVSAGDELGRISWQGADGTNLEESASVSAWVEGTPANNSIASRLSFSTRADGASSPTERMRIKSTGIIHFSNAPAYADNAAAATGGLAVGDVYRTSTGQLMIRY